MNTIANINLDMAQSVFSGIYLKRFKSIRNSRFTWLHSQYKYIQVWLVCILNVIPNLSSRSLTKKNYFHTVIKSEYFPTEVYLDFYFTGYVNERIYKFCVIIYTIIVKLIQFRFVVVIYIHSYVRLIAIQVLLSYLQVHLDLQNSRAAVHLNFWAGSTFRSQFVLYLALWTGIPGATRLTHSNFMLYIGWIYFYQRGRFACSVQRNISR